MSEPQRTSKKLNAPPDTPSPRIGWLIGGSLLVLIGIAMAFSVIMTAVGIALCVAGGMLVVASFISRSGRNVRKQAESHTQLGESTARAIEKTEKTMDQLSENQALKESGKHTDIA